jgi:hypothetical protein
MISRKPPSPPRGSPRWALCPRLVASVLAALLSQRFPSRDLRVGGFPIEEHVQREVGVLPADQRAGVGVYNMQLSIAEVVVFEPLDLCDALSGFRGAGILDADILEKRELEAFVSEIEGELEDHVPFL